MEQDNSAISNLENMSLLSYSWTVSDNISKGKCEEIKPTMILKLIKCLLY